MTRDTTAPTGLWLEQALGDVPPRPPLSGSATVDVAIVGGGFTGLWTAFHLAELDPTLRIAVLEAGHCGSGASGRNGGFVLGWAAKVSTLRKEAGDDEAKWLVKASEDNIAEIGRFCLREGVNAEFVQQGWLWTASNAAQVGSWSSAREELAELGLESVVREVDQAELAQRTGSARHIAGVMLGGAIVHPGHFVRGLARAVEARGVRIFERSPMLDMAPGATVAITTPTGMLQAQRVVIAMNAWSARFRSLRRRIMIVGSDIVATPPIPEHLSALGLDRGSCISDSRLFTHYYRPTRDGRLVFGKGGGDFAFGGRIGQNFHGASPYAKPVEQALRWFYPNLSDVPVERSWTGPIDRTLSGLPSFGFLPGIPNVAYGFGWSGNGVGPCRIGGRILASLALERKDEWSTCALVSRDAGKFPPEPLRWIGSRIVRQALSRKERAEDLNRAPRKLDLALAGLAPGGLVPVARKKRP